MILKGTDSSSSSIFFSKSEIITNIGKGKSAASSIVFFGQIIVENAHQCKIKGQYLKTLNTFYSNREMLLRVETNNHFHFILTTSNIDVLFAP